MDLTLDCQLEQNVERVLLEVSTGKVHENSLSKKHLAGHAYLPAGSNVYEIKLMMFPRHTYFMRENRKSANHYTIFSKRQTEENETRLSNPVAFGRLSMRVKNFVEIYVPLLGRVLYLDLIPKN